MRKKVHLFVLGCVCIITACLMLPSVIVALIYQEPEALKAFLITIVIALSVGLLFAHRKPDMSEIVPQDGFIIAAEAWVIVSLLGAVPFFVSGAIPNFIDCLFESASGFTTTGASILTNVEVLPRAILFWRSFSHWVGGMGVLVFMLAVVSMVGGKSIYLMRAESPGPIVDKLVPKMRQSATILYSIYIGMTVVLIILLIAGGMPIFDSLCHAFGTAGTGGFSIKNASIGAYNSQYLQWVITIFMFLFGINFNVYFLLILGRIKDVFKNEELLTYSGIVITVVLLIAWNIYSIYGNFYEAFRESAFQVSSIMTTTGYATTDFNLWPEFSRSLIVLLMFIGGSAGSTAGGLKVARIILLLKIVRKECRRILNPRSVEVISFNGKAVDEETVSSTSSYLFIFIVIFALSNVLLALGDYDLETTFTAVTTCMNNVGPGLNMVGPTGNFHFFSGFEKIVLIIDMLIGRLEIFPMIMLLTPLFRHKSSRNQFWSGLKRKRRATFLD